MKCNEMQIRHIFIIYIGIILLGSFLLVNMTAGATVTSGTGSVITPDGSKKYSVDRIDMIMVYDTATNELIGYYEGGGFYPYLIMNSDGTKVFAIDRTYYNTINVMHPLTDTRWSDEVFSFFDYHMQGGNAIRLSDRPMTFFLSPDETMLYVATQHGDFVFFDTRTETIKKIIKTDATEPVVSFSSDGKYCYMDGESSTGSPVSVAIDTTTYTFVNPQSLIPEKSYTPTITWNNPDNIISGTALSSTQLNAVASVPGTFVYTPAAGTVLNAGTQTLHVDFTPTDIANYNITSKNITINVLKATPTITWNNPADIIYGTVMSSTQLNAIASVPGTFVYTPASGTVLSAGTQTLKIDFTPTDTTNYTTASASVQINILSPAQGIQQITTEVQSLNLIPEQANLLVVKLDTAAKNLNAGNTNAAANELNAFINQVSADINNGKISSTEGQSLINAANTVINAINPHATSVPEFPSVALPVVAILGLVLIFGRKKE